jgi:hypothetical protein
LPIHRARGQISSRKDRQIGDDCEGVEGGGEVENWQGMIWEVPSDHSTTRIYKGGLREKNFQKIKMAGEDPPDPLHYFEVLHEVEIYVIADVINKCGASPYLFACQETSHLRY